MEERREIRGWKELLGDEMRWRAEKGMQRMPFASNSITFRRNFVVLMK
jgi:hypothetical protein